MLYLLHGTKFEYSKRRTKNEIHLSSSKPKYVFKSSLKILKSFHQFPYSFQRFDFLTLNYDDFLFFIFVTSTCAMLCERYRLRHRHLRIALQNEDLIFCDAVECIAVHINSQNDRFVIQLE